MNYKTKSPPLQRASPLRRKSWTPLTERMRIFAGIAFVWLLAALVLSGAELVLNWRNIAPGDAMTFIVSYKTGSTLLFWIKTCLPLLLVYLPASCFSLRLASRLSVVLVLSLVLVQEMLITYFSRSLAPLGADLFGYSMKEIIQTAGASGGIHFVPVTFFVFFCFLLYLLLRRMTRTGTVPGWLAWLLPAVSALVILAAPENWAAPGKLSSEFDANLVSDKADYFVRQSRDHFFPDPVETDIYSDSYAGQEEDRDSSATPFTYPDAAGFPFFHMDSSRDVLSPFFARLDSLPGKRPPPNIVIIVVEGLGRAFTNAGAYLGDFTPFIDSLARHGLYWKNCLSEGGRTFAVLPSLLGSLPFGKNGFLEMGRSMPRQLSLINILKANGYHTSFCYGGDAHFDNMDIFLQKNGIDELNDGKTFPAGYTKLPASNGFSWGYDDGAVYRHTLDGWPSTGPSPQLKIILTVSTHSPFAINGQARYAGLFEQRMTEEGMNEQQKNDHRANKDQYASILYADDALRGFFAACSKRADYLNTIFMITGDHRMPEIPMRSKIDRFHVPLILFSPLLKRTAEFESISTHFDLTPSLLAFLGSAFRLRTPASGVSWMGSGLDTARQFRNIHAYPLMQSKNDLLDFVSGEYHLNGSALFRLTPDMNEDPVPDDQRRNQLYDAFARFQHRNNRVVGGAELVPDSSFLFLGK